MATAKRRPSLPLKMDGTMIFLGAGALALAYFGIIRPVMKKVHIIDDPAVKQQEQANNDKLLAWKAEILKRQKPTKTEYEWKIVADNIYNDLRYTWLDDNKEDAGYQVCRVQNDADVALLITAFAKRTEYWFGINAGAPKDLPAFIRTNLQDSKINLINANYLSKGIKFRF